MRLYIATLVFAICCLAVLAGCGGGGGGSKESGGGTSEIYPNVRVISQSGDFQANQDGSITLSGAVPTIAEGDVIVSDLHNGLLAKAKHITRTRDGSVTIATEPASLDDVLQRSEVSIVRDLNPADAPPPQILLDGVTYEAGPSAASRSRDVGPYDRTFRFPDVLVSVAGISARINGTITLRIGIRVNWNKDESGFKSFEFTPYLSVSSGLKITSDQIETSALIPVAHIPLPEIKIVIPFGPIEVPIVFNKGELQFGVKLGGGAGIHGLGVSFGNRLSVELQTRYDAGQGFSMNPTYNLQSDAPTLPGFPSNDVEFYISPLTAEASYKLYGVDAWKIFASAELPRFTASLTHSSNPPGINLDVSRKLHFEGGMKLEILKKTLADGHLEGETPSVRMGGWFFPTGGGDTRTEVLVDNSDEVHDINAAGFFRWGTPSFWHTATSDSKGPLGVNGSMLWTRNNHAPDHPLDNVAQWRPNLTGSGRYEVYAYIPHNFATTQSAKYEVWVNGSYATTTQVNQNAVFDDWVSLGQFDLAKGTGSSIRLLDTTNETYNTRYVGIDAVKFVPR